MSQESIIHIKLEDLLLLHRQCKTSVSLLSSDDFFDPYTSFKSIHAFGAKKVISLSSGSAFSELQDLIDEKDWLFGVLGYDLKNEIEDLSSQNFDGLQFPDLCFFIPKWVVKETKEGFTLYGDAPSFKTLISNIRKTSNTIDEIQLRSRISKSQYLSHIDQIRHAIQQGDLYEMNYCFEFFQEHVEIHLFSLFQSVQRQISTPFMGFFQHADYQMLSISPERYLAKRGNKLISQPIKGTAKRGETDLIDSKIKEALVESLKEQTENTMIVDLVRNDLGKCGVPGSVDVEEYLKLYTFPNIHQLISRVTATVAHNLSHTEIIKETFPMGSMTGAPKYKVMELTEELEQTKRGWYSGALGYFEPNGNFDFNVVIRSLLYHKTNKYLSCMVGGGITSFSDPEQEYEECLIKLNSILRLLKSTIDQ